ncbi:SDR family NAD(P)-dependent oxidoreductase [Mucilaginibacter sp. Bleaf8]|uniref:SDR family NAD(P)-dependent oxidoreductase n=1 Tax=Mucilaginibacter sp. Bleaf8 TaxID=2834430 RepID=UPI001BD14637|nr:SDR family NAD(P)-dependent oxidoreductase [Mucilaginibacter sp. Bleaf8]MBS7563014.1 SDR family NAD(P)-dependent oxidoreductase [Mucilaginibacter sp. Bleaf8]
MSKLQNVLITGAAGGFGRVIIEALLKEGYTVTGALRDAEGRNRQAAETLQQQGAHVVEIDVTDDESVVAGVHQAAEWMGGIDVLINNAGIGTVGIQESFTADDWKKVFDVNVFGVQRMTRAVLPYMKQKQQGLLLLISSLSARLAVPFPGPYCPSKWAAEALAESYRTEVSNLGIESCIIEPGAFPTHFVGSLLQAGDKERTLDYGPIKDLPAEFLASLDEVFKANPEQSPDLVSAAVINLLKMQHGKRPVRTEVDTMIMGSLVSPLNKQLEEANQKLYEAFQMTHLTKVKS